MTERTAPPIFFRGKKLQLSKARDDDGTSAHPVNSDEAWRKIGPFLKQTGVTRISDITQLDRIGIPVFNVLRPSLDGYSAAHGKGFTATAAKLSAAGESMERWYGTRDNTPSFRSTWKDLARSYSMVPPELSDEELEAVVGGGNYSSAAADTDPVVIDIGEIITGGASLLVAAAVAAWSEYLLYLMSWSVWSYFDMPIMT